MKTTKKNVFKYILLILLLPFLWIYGLYKLYKAYKADNHLQKKYIALSIVSILFFIIAISQTGKSDNKEIEVANSENIIEAQISSKESTTEPQSTTVVANTTEQQTTIITEPITESQTISNTEPQNNIETSSESPSIIITEPVSEIATTEALSETNVEIMFRSKI